MQQFSELPPLALYIHFPWCIEKCPYCDFNSHELKQDLPELNYINALLSDLDNELPLIWGRQIDSIFMGGGTPSLFSADSLAQLLSQLRARLNFKPNIEITLEANPGAVEQARFRAYRELGINRLSIGVQSFNQKHLQSLGRVHSAREAIKAIEIAHQAEFDNINLDLMYALPNQTIGEAKGDIQMALAFNPNHLSHYQLTIEPNTLFYHRPPITPEEEDVIEMEITCREQLTQAGFERYEISAFAKPEHRCLHNLNYWSFGDYLGIGAGAHGKITDSQQQQIQRRWKTKHPDDYMAGNYLAGHKTLSNDEVRFEFMLNALRLIDGFDTTQFQRHCGQPIYLAETPLKQAEQQAFIEWELNHIRPTALGLQYLNNLTELFLPPDAG